jgi:hypothetical protein
MAAMREVFHSDSGNCIIKTYFMALFLGGHAPNERFSGVSRSGRGVLDMFGKKFSGRL